MNKKYVEFFPNLMLKLLRWYKTHRWNCRLRFRIWLQVVVRDEFLLVVVNPVSPSNFSSSLRHGVLTTPGLIIVMKACDEDGGQRHGAGLVSRFILPGWELLGVEVSDLRD